MQFGGFAWPNGLLARISDKYGTQNRQALENPPPPL